MAIYQQLPILRGVYKQSGARDSADYFKQVRFQLDVRVIFLSYKDN